MSKNLKLLTPAQKKANARNQLFRQIHGYSLKPFIDRAIKEGAITAFEKLYLSKILSCLHELKSRQFIGSKEIGLNPRRRCAYCNNIAHWKANIIGTEKYLCNKHKEEAERDNKRHINNEYTISNIQEINPYE